MITPTVGRIVWYYPAWHLTGDQPQAAIIVWVHDDHCVNLGVFDRYGTWQAAASVHLVQDEAEPPKLPYCIWPTRVD